MTSDVFSEIRSRVVGEGVIVPGPYGSRRVTYADHAASGRLYRPIEERICRLLAPTYGNVHSETSFVAAQTNHLREEAREVIRKSLDCGPDDAVIFAGNGATGAVRTLLDVLGWSLPCCFCDRFPGVSAVVPPAKRPVVFVSTFEHHSVLLPLREAEVDLVEVPSCAGGADDLDGGVDVGALRALLARYAAAGKVNFAGFFSAASNVTGRVTDVDALAECLHGFAAETRASGRPCAAIACFDCAAAGPYVPLSMSAPEGRPLAYKDALFLSPHKMLGGPGSPGVLAAKVALFRNRVPHVPGGGTVAWVTPSEHRYLPLERARDVEHREEGGTPNILGAVKAGLAFQLRDAVNAAVTDTGASSATTIYRRELDHAARLVAALLAIPEVVVLGDLNTPRLATVSFLVRCSSDPSARLLHHNFVVALLSDLFGVQARGGNSCAAAFSHRLLGVSGAQEQALGEAVSQGWHGAKPGWTRLSPGYYDSSETIDHLTRCVAFIAARGSDLLADYAFDPRSGTWRKRGWVPELLGLDSASGWPELGVNDEGIADQRASYLASAAAIADEASGRTAPFEPTPFEGLRWFVLPGETW